MATTILANVHISQQVEDEAPIVLSDLVRTAEASRLRRRGAITASHRANRQPSLTSYVPSDTWLGNPDYRRNRPPVTSQPVIPTQFEAAMPPVYPSWSETVDPSKVEEETDSSPGSGYELYCGFEIEIDDEEAPYKPSPLPMHSSAPRSSRITPLKFRRSTGCGALIHTDGSPQTKSGTWNAKGKATDAVVSMDKMYFERGGESKQFACGCRWQGVGCSVCGNPLGNVYVPCQAATVTPASPQNQARSPRSTRASTSASQHHVYTFFSNAVSSAPGFEFPASCSASTHDVHGQSAPPQPGSALGASGAYADFAAAQGWEGMAGMPTGEESEYTYGGYMDDQEETGNEVDADGVQIAAEPGSPDKPSFELMFLPAR